MKLCTFDFETASMCDLKQAGSWRYAEDLTTEILCLCWELDGIIEHWTPASSEEDTNHLHGLALNPGILFIAHNAGFEKAIWRRIMVPVFGFPDIPDERWHDTQAVCAAKALPLKLELAAHVLGLEEQKDTAGSRFTINLSKANKKGYFDRSPGTIQRVVAYCDQDVRAEKALHERIGFLDPGERNTWLLDQKINQRGVCLDGTFCATAMRVVEGASVPILKEFALLTGGLTPTKVAKVKEWCQSHGAHLPDMKKETIADVLGFDIDGDWEPDDDWIAPPLMPDVRRALSIRQLTASASVKKLPRMLASVCSDGRTRGLLQYHGASTGRWSGRLYQPQNFPKPTVFMPKGMTAEDWESLLFNAIMTGDHEYVQTMVGSPTDAVITALRFAVVAERDRMLAVGDYAGIEARVVLALAGQHDKTALIAGGLDPYLDFASIVLGRAVTEKSDPARNKTGKPGVLGCGFGMGAKKLAAKEGLLLDDAQAIVDTYRKDWAPLVKSLWYGLEGAATKAVWEGGAHEAFGCTYQMVDGWLTCRMPSGRRLWYNEPTKCLRAMPWDKADIRRGFTYRSWKKGGWRLVNAYGGLLTENVVQALARDIMKHSMDLCEAENYPIILTVHDEIIAEPEAARADAKVLTQIMEERPQWAVDMQCPIAVECWTGPRYKKG